MAPTRPLAESVEAADNPEPRCPCLLLLDTSGSMQGERLATLTSGLLTFRAALLADPITAHRIEVAVVTFGSRVETVDISFAKVVQERDRQRLSAQIFVELLGRFKGANYFLFRKQLLHDQEFCEMVVAPFG